MSLLRSSARTPRIAAFALAASVLLAASQRDASERPAFWRVLERGLEKGGVADEAQVVLEHLRGVPQSHAGVAHRLTRVDGMLREPWTPPALAAELRELLAGPAARKKPAKQADVLAGSAAWLDVEWTEDAALADLDERWERIAAGELQGLALLESLSDYIGAAHAALDGALSGLAPEEWPLLFERHAAFCEAWYRSHFPGAQLAEDDARALEEWSKLLVTAERVDRRRQLGVAAALARLADPTFVNSLARRIGDVRSEGAPDGALAAVGDEASRRVLVYGRGSDEHAERAALVIDLAGKDRYARAACVDSADCLASVLIDLAGDDVYESAQRGPAYAAGGVALLVDVKGDDRYRSGRLGQAAAALGCALLVDLAGDDAYELEDYGQGHALAGVALLYDALGNDRYEAWAYAQGAGIARGLSALVDGDGDDRYTADGHWPDVYGDSGPDVYHGASQGYATGLRPSVAGGIAALIDLGAGKDRYQAGSFSQGGGYYFSFGLMSDGGGDDESFGSRYAQGFGVHQAVGLRWDAAGNDRSVCRSVAHCGMAWDEGVGYSIDDAGDDRYQAGALACGGAAQTGVAVLIDAGGADHYVTADQSQGGIGGSEYHDKPSLAFLLDLGGGADQYSQPGRSDETLFTVAGAGVSVDVAAKDAERALAAKLLKPD